MARETNLAFNLAEEYAAKLKVLLETMHLYQKVSIDIKKIVEAFVGNAKQLEGLDVANAYIDGIVKNYRPVMAIRDQESLNRHVAGKEPLALVGNLKFYCDRCRNRESFAPLAIREFAKRFEKQVFAIDFQCLNCSIAQIVCLVGSVIRDSGRHLILEGRSPFEHVQLPPQMQCEEEALYRDALIALHGGKILAALFYLRTFIEQFARRIVEVSSGTKLDVKLTGDQLMTMYAETLPKEKRDMMPSLRSWYERLSAALHSASEDEKLFGEASEAIEQHFDIRRVFKL